MPRSLAGRSFWIRNRRLRETLIAAAHFLPARRWRVIGSVDDADNVPDSLPSCRAVLVATSLIDKWLAFDCPCGAGHRILLNLDKSRSPSWRLRVSIMGKITLSPSVDFEDGHKRCHFTIRRGRVAWTRDSTHAAPDPFGRPR